jgi:hypothetical protein
MLFLLAMEPLHKLFKKVQHYGLLSHLSNGCDAFRASLFADAAAIFMKLTPQDPLTVNCILSIFAQASGLQTNSEKTQVFPIRCEGLNMDFLSLSNYAISSFPCSYLGLPLHIKKIPSLFSIVSSRKLQTKFQDGKGIF